MAAAKRDTNNRKKDKLGLMFRVNLALVLLDNRTDEVLAESEGLDPPCGRENLATSLLDLPLLLRTSSPWECPSDFPTLRDELFRAITVKF